VRDVEEKKLKPPSTRLGNEVKSIARIWQSVLAALCSAVVLGFVALTGCERFNESLTRGLEVDKSYTRSAMEYRREHPDTRRGNSVLDAWSEADYIALDVARQKLNGEWEKPSDQLAFLPTELKLDSRGKPFCVIQRGQVIIVLRILDRTTLDCAMDTSEHLDISKIHSGDLEFSGRTDYWIYVLKRPDAQ